MTSPETRGRSETRSTVTIRTVAGDYNGDGKADLSLFLRASQAQWLIQGVTSGTPFGVGTLDIPVQGDFNGDGRTDLATYRPTTARWFAQGVFSDVQYGQGLVDIPAPADYFGTGVTTIATFRPTTGEWFIPNAPGPIPHFGGPGDIPVPGDYLTARDCPARRLPAEHRRVLHRGPGSRRSRSAPRDRSRCRAPTITV